MKRDFVFFAVLSFLIWIQWGCAGVKKTVDTQPTIQPTMVVFNPVVILTPVPTMVPVGKYTVAKHDTLWAIAGNQYKDCFQWPLIFQANRDQIRDPDFIYPDQVFLIVRGHSEKIIESAKKSARLVPKFHRRKK